MLQYVLLLLWVAWASPSAEASDFILWLEPELPEDRMLVKGQRVSGAKDHLFHRHLAFPPQPETPEDAAKYLALKQAMDDGLSQWEEFDVELDIARTLAARLDAITVVRDPQDLERVVEARLFQGAAIYRSFDPSRFDEDADASVFRFEQPGYTGNLAWSIAMGIDPTRRLSRSDVIDASTFMEAQTLESTFKALPKGTIDFTHLTQAETIVLDGRQMQVTPGEKVSVAPGMHYLHVLADGVISGRQRIEVTSGAEVSVPFFVDHTELSLAKSKVVNGVTTGFPESVKSAIESIAKSRKGAIFVGAMDDNGQPVILPYARGAKLSQNRKGAFILFGGAGFALSKSKILDEEGLVNEDWVPTGLAQFGFEASYSYFCVTAGVDASVPSGRSVRFGTPEGETAEDDQSTLILPQPWFGVGSYILRPFDNSHTLLVAATMEYLFPAHTGYGGRISWGLPSQSGNAWFRVTAGGAYAAQPHKKWQALEVYRDSGFVKLSIGVSGGGRF